jgi:HK97 family phage prohead protease
MPRARHLLHRAVAAFERKEAAGSAHEWEQLRVGKPFQIAATDEKGTFEGLGVVFNVEHPTSSWGLGPEWKDVIRPGSFAETLAEHKANGTRPAMFYMHERGNIPGVWQDIAEGKDGLNVKGMVFQSAISPSGVPVYELMKSGALTGISPGFRVRKYSLDEAKKVREIFNMEVSELSVVDIPGGPLSRITDVKSGDPKNIQFLETVLRDAGLSRKEAKALLAEGFTALRDVAADDVPTQRDADRSAEGIDDQSLAESLRGFRATIRP